jgi:hypothetical protein
MEGSCTGAAGTTWWNGQLTNGVASPRTRNCASSGPNKEEKKVVMARGVSIPCMGAGLPEPPMQSASVTFAAEG